MCHSIVGSKTYMAPEVFERRVRHPLPDDPGYDAGKVRRCEGPAVF